MKDAIKKLRKFHRKHNFPLDQDLTTAKDDVAIASIKEVACLILTISQKLEDTLAETKSSAVRRAQLMTEELGEALEGLANQDEEKLLDGLADSIFVNIGTAESYGLPIYEALIEVCNSNLTKAARNESDLRLRDKGDNYVAPDLKAILRSRKCKG